MLLYYVQTLLTGLFVVLVIFFNLKNSVKNKETNQKLFMAELFVNGLLLIFELLLNILNGKTYPYAREILTLVVAVFYTLNPVVGFLWVLYIHSLINYKKISFNKTAIILSIPIIFNFILSMVSIFYPIMFYIDAGNIYNRGPFFIILFFISLINPIISFILIILSRKSIKKSYIKTLIFFTFIPTFSGLLQTLFFGASFVWSFTALAHLLVYMDINSKIIENSRQAELANEAKNIFLAKVSHELRNPLHGIKASASILAETKLEEEQKKYLGYIRESTILLSHIINDLLDLSKLEADKLEFSNNELEINKIVNLVIDNMNIAANDKGIKLYADVQSDLPVFIGDSTRIYQILVNLVHNAIKFTDQGEVLIHLYIEEEDENKSKLNFEVKDTGMGISEKDIDLIFNKFTQLDKSISRRFQGVGMGLAIVKWLVEKMQGTIQIKSTLGIGSTFTVTIWLEKANTITEISENIERAKQPIHIINLPILIVEDNIKINQQIAKAIIKSMGIESVSVSDGSQAVSAVIQNQYSLILMDCHMPVMDGYEATEKIRELEKTKGIHTPIIAMTADAMEENQRLCLALGMDDYIIKPFDKKELIDKINKWLNL